VPVATFHLNVIDFSLQDNAFMQIITARIVSDACHAEKLQSHFEPLREGHL
jgi:hypothetical protein